MTLDYGIAPPGYRLPDLTRLGAVRLQVADSAARSTTTSACSVCGCSIAMRGRRRLAPRVRNSRSSSFTNAPACGRFRGQGCSGCITSPSCCPIARPGRFVAHLGTLGEHAGSADHAVSEALYLADPDCLGTEVYAIGLVPSGNTTNVSCDHHCPARHPKSSCGGGGSVRGPACHRGPRWATATCTWAASSARKRFYHRALGFDKVVWSYPGALFLSAGGYHHHLGNNTWSSGPPASPCERGGCSGRLSSQPRRLSRTPPATSARRGRGSGVRSRSRLHRPVGHERAPDAAAIAFHDKRCSDPQNVRRLRYRHRTAASRNPR